ncbi:hypothetical protein KFU94_44930 [Chloroflexi bacterium TSY]|nr:hypothetical protein [Chloroflexi bacterium TSY]
MMKEKTSQNQVVAQAEKGLTVPNRVWHQLSPPHQRQILQSLVQICQMLTQRRVKQEEVAHEPLN